MVRVYINYKMVLLALTRLSQSALFNFQSLLLTILLLIYTCTYTRAVAPRLVDRNKEGYVLIWAKAIFAPDHL
jgi:hypothetical protein